MALPHELFVTYNGPSLFLELLCDYSKAIEKGFIKLQKLRQTSADTLKLPELPFMINLSGEIIQGEAVLSEQIARIAGVFEILFGLNQDVIDSHFEFFKNYRENTKTPKAALEFLNKHLLKRTFCNGSHITVSDLYAYAEIVGLIATLPDQEKWTYNNIIRWADHMQNLPGLKEKIRECRLKISLPYEPLFLESEEAKPVSEVKKDKKDAKREAKEAFLAKGGQIGDKKKENNPTEKKVENIEIQPESKPNTTKENIKTEKPKNDQKGAKNASSKPKDPLEDAHPASKLDIRVGKVVSIHVNEKSEKLYNEEIDIGNGEIRKIASGLKGRVDINDLKDSLVIVLANLKPRTLCDWPSHGMILCASDANGNIEPIRPPAGSQAGDAVHIGEFARTPVAELNPKKSPWEAVQPEMTVNSSNIAVYQGSSQWHTDKGLITTKSVNNAKIS
jgi:methionine--tRNA ligase beta chain